VAITQGLSAAELETFWLAQRIANLILKPAIGKPLPVMDRGIAFSPHVEDS
jgi:hypothetical protein